MKRLNHLLVAGLVFLAALTMILPQSGRAGESSVSKSSSSSSDDPAPSAAKRRAASNYKRLLDELEVERRHVEELEREVKALQSSNSQLQQTTTNLQTSNQQLVTQTSQSQKQINAIQKTVYSQLGPFNFGDRVNAFLGQHYFTMVGDASAGYYYSRQGGFNDPVLEFEVNPMLRPTDWIQFYGAIGASASVGGISLIGPTLANMQVFPLGREAPLELVAGLFDTPFGDFYENQGPVWVNPFVTFPLLYGAEAIVPPASLGLQARGGIQWGGLGQDVDYTVWADSGPSFESQTSPPTIPEPIIGERLNPLTGTNINTNGKGFGGRFRLFPIPIEADLGRLELMATTYNGKWLNGLWYNSWGLGYAYRVGPFRTRGEWAQTYRSMPSPSQVPGITGMPPYPGCCGHENRQGWYTMFGYFLYGIPHPYLGDWLEPRVDKTEFLVRYSGVNEPAILANDITNVPVQGFSGSPAIFNPHSREVALALDYWLQPNIVWQTEVDFELPEAGGTLYNFPGGATPPVESRIGATANDVAVMTQLTLGF
jgi:hypothetical protein